jgi:ABC-type glycerol-3-phosphate transport system substrate-binding protein
MPRRILDAIQQPGVMDPFSRAYPKILVSWVAVDPGTQDSLLAGSSGNIPDLMYVEGQRLGALSSKGYLADLTAFAAPVISNYPDYLRSIATFEGKTFAIPFHSNPVVMYFRRDVFAKAGLPSDNQGVESQLATWDALLSACVTIKAKTGLFCFDLTRASNNGQLFETMLSTAGLGYYNQGGELAIDDPRRVAVLQELSGFWKAKVTGTEPEWSPAWLDHLSSGDASVAVVFGPPSLGEDLRTWIAPERAGEWGVSRTPAFDANQHLTGAQAGGFLALTAKSTNLQAAWALANYLSSELIVIRNLWIVDQLFPALPAMYSDTFSHLPDPYFGGQVVGEVYAQAAVGIPDALIYSPAYALIHANIIKATQRTALGLSTPIDALGQASKDIQSKLKQP